MKCPAYLSKERDMWASLKNELLADSGNKSNSVTLNRDHEVYSLI